MSTIDSMLDGDEAIVRHLAAVAGPLVAESFVSDFNNGCMQMAGFETEYEVISARMGVRLFAPLHNMSRMECH